jgi:hypothetical protein
MKKFVSTACAAAFLGLSSLGGLVPAAAAGPMHQGYQQQDRYIGNFCDRNPNAGQCNDWRSNHSNWGNSQYNGFYRAHRNDNGFGGNLAAGLFGFAIGAALTSSPGYMSDHVGACQNRYHSYNARTDTFLGYDGLRHACRL